MADQFQQRWQFPHALGSCWQAYCYQERLDSTYYNYKVGDVGSRSDGQIWNHCELCQAIEDGVIGIPDAESLLYDDMDTLFYLVADDAFAMRTWLMKPFGRMGLDHDALVFDYCLSRDYVVENASGLLANSFHCLLSTLQVDIDTVKLIVRTCVVLHNFLRERIADVYVLD